MKDNIELSREVLYAFGSSNINGTLVTLEVFHLIGEMQLCIWVDLNL